MRRLLFVRRLHELDTPDAKRAYLNQQIARAAQIRQRAGSLTDDQWHVPIRKTIEDDITHWESGVRADLAASFGDNLDLFFDSNDEPQRPTREGAIDYLGWRITRLERIRDGQVPDQIAKLEADLAWVEKKRDEGRGHMRALIEDTQKWQGSYDRARDRVAELEKAGDKLADDVKAKFPGLQRIVDLARERGDVPDPDTVALVRSLAGWREVRGG